MIRLLAPFIGLGLCSSISLACKILFAVAVCSLSVVSYTVQCALGAPRTSIPTQTLAIPYIRWFVIYVIVSAFSLCSLLESTRSSSSSRARCGGGEGEWGHVKVCPRLWLTQWGPFAAVFKKLRFSLRSNSASDAFSVRFLGSSLVALPASVSSGVRIA